MESYLNAILSHLTKWLTVYTIAVVAIETIANYFYYRKQFVRENIKNGVMLLFAVATQGVIKTYILANLFLVAYQYRIFDIGFHWYTWVAGFFLYTFIDYFTHVIYHKCRLFWCFHIVHHSAIHMNATTGFRGSIFDIFSLNIFYFLFPILGIHPVVYFIIYTIHKFWGVLIHVNEKWINKIGIFEYFLTSPSNHHLHHASNIKYLDKNYGEFVPWYDMIFGTYVQEDEKPIYGTQTINAELGFWEAQLYEFKNLKADLKNAKNFKEKLNFLFNVPGWSPDGLENTAAFQQKLFLQQNQK
jgi:sterol desaturase/sphingolipid hydroxylase (fatty acid hydroxylase superfamily)